MYSPCIHLSSALQAQAYPYLSALVETLTGPESFDLALHESKLYPHYLRFLGAQNEDGSFCLRHLGISSETLEKMSNDESGQKLLGQNTSLVSLRLYGFFTPGTLRALASLPHLTHLDLSHGTCDEESVKNLTSYLQGDHHLVSFQGPKMDEKPFLPSASLRPLGP